MASETYPLTTFSADAAKHLRDRFYMVRDKLRGKIVQKRGLSFFLASDEFRQIMAMKEASPVMWDKLTLHTAPLIVFTNDLTDGEDFLDYNEPKYWQVKVTGYKLPMLDDLTYAWVHGITEGHWPVTQALTQEGGLEDYGDAKVYSEWGKSVRALTKDYLTGFRNINQIYWSFPDLVEVLKTMGSYQQRPGPRLDLHDAWDNCHIKYNRRRRPNITKVPPEELKKLVATLKLVGSTNGED